MSEYIVCPYCHNPLSQSEYVKVVRCRDCKFADEDESGALRCNGHLVEPWDYYEDEPNDGVKVEPDGFCAWAERRTDDN